MIAGIFISFTGLDRLINKIWTPADKAFKKWCYLDILKFTYLVDKNPVVAGQCVSPIMNKN